MLNLLTLSVAFGGLALAQSTTQAPTSAELAAAEYSALAAIAPYASEEYSVAVVEIASLLALLPSGVAVSGIPSLISQVTPAEVTYVAAPLAAYISAELSEASAPSTLQAAVPSIAVALVEGFVPLAESLIGGLYPVSMPLSELPASMLADEPAILSIFSKVVPDIFLALAPAITSAHPEVATLLPSAVEAWVLGIPPAQTGAAVTPTVASATATGPVAYGSTTPAGSASAYASSSVSVASVPASVKSSAVASLSSYGSVSSVVKSVTVVVSSGSTGPVAYSTVSESSKASTKSASLVTYGSASSSGVQQQSATSSAPVEQQTTNAGMKLMMGGEILAFAGMVAGVALL